MTGRAALAAISGLAGARALLPIGLLWALGAEWMRLERRMAALVDRPSTFVPGVVFLIAGQVAWDRRPDTRVGPLMVAIGFAWYVGTYGASEDPRLAMVAHAFQGYFNALLAWLVLAYPSGRLRDRTVSTGRRWRGSRCWPCAARFGLRSTRRARTTT